MKSVVKASIVAATIIGSLVAVTNPLNLFVEKSSRFNRERFDSVRIGMDKSELVRLLGEPLRVTQADDFYYPCSGCYIYYFMGNAPDWLIFYEEAWVHVGPEGSVRGKAWNIEP